MEPPTSCTHCVALLQTESSLPPIPSDILSTNRPPLDTEILCIRDVVAAEKTRKTRLDAQIAALRSSLKKLIADRDSLKEEIRLHEGTLSPLRRMPTELLSLVFKSAAVPDKDPAPWTISQVCRRWRAIVVSQPSFWASIFLDFQFEDTYSITRSRLEGQLQRTGNLPLNVVFACRNGYFEYTERELDLLGLVASQSVRWESIRIAAPLSIFSALAGVRGRLPLLRKIEILAHPSDAEEHSVNIFEFAPKLEQASVNPSGRPITAVLPFPQLLQYVAHNTWNGHLHSLRSALNLVECALEFTEISTPPTTLITLPHLLRLSISKSNFLECLDVPKLQELYCCPQSDHLSSLLRRRPHSLRKLVMPRASVTDVAGILRSVPALTDIGIFIPESSADVLVSLLTIRNATADVGPNLRSIHIGSSREEPRAASAFTLAMSLHGWQNSLVDMVESRWRGGQLRSITLPDFRRHQDHERLVRLEGEGLNIQFSPRHRRDDLDMIPTALRLRIYH
ncbi:hypothetical protein DFH07DRAFT_812695 [Mycena maculata]|uniref:F-box domain-containing protein n=1 Tax=Mycena maculata TaxID=230809 RepID=A0AAD7JH02_9AGAR|nr:hypothetical protein DFH07DRAFT_812695 [Mycena maculata]